MSVKAQRKGPISAKHRHYCYNTCYNVSRAFLKDKSRLHYYSRWERHWMKSCNLEEEVKIKVSSCSAFSGFTHAISTMDSLLLWCACVLLPSAEWNQACLGIGGYYNHRNRAGTAIYCLLVQWLAQSLKPSSLLWVFVRTILRGIWYGIVDRALD